VWLSYECQERIRRIKEKEEASDRATYRWAIYNLFNLLLASVIQLIVCVSP